MFVFYIIFTASQIVQNNVGEIYLVIKMLYSKQQITTHLHQFKMYKLCKCYVNKFTQYVKYNLHNFYKLFKRIKLSSAFTFSQQRQCLQLERRKLVPVQFTDNASTMTLQNNFRGRKGKNINLVTNNHDQPTI